MIANTISLQYDLNNPDSLVNSVKSYIHSKLDDEKKNSEFIKDIRRKLYLIHECNCQVAKDTHKYPRTRKFDLLLVKYVELEFDVLYHNNQRPSRQCEITTELRILRLLQVMLYPAVLNNESLINEKTDRILKKAVLQLLGEVKSTYLIENKLICNIINKLFRKIGDASNDLNIKKTPISEIHKNLATSDYGTDDSDSDFDDDVFGRTLRSKQVAKSNPVDSDCVEVPVTEDGVCPIPTVEFADDEDNYFVYLQKRVSTKRKNTDYSRDISIKRSQLEQNSNSVHEVTIKNYKECTLNKLESVPKNTHGETSCVLLSSDSEDEICKVTSVGNKRKTKKPHDNHGVVTFEILDDDDGDDKPNYMVYLQKEVETSKNPKKQKVCDEIIICSDSEDDFGESIEECEIKIEENKLIDSDGDLQLYKMEPLLPFSENIAKSGTYSYCDNEINSESDIKINNTSEKITNLITERTAELQINNQLQTCVVEEPQLQVASTSQHMDADFLILENNVGVAIDQNLETNFLVDPTVIFERITPGQSSTNGEKKLDEIVNQNNNEALLSVKNEIRGPFVLGGPVLSETLGSSEDLENPLECRINESLLEELLLDDSYLLEGRKEFEELESFLFSDKQRISFGNVSFDDNESLLQPDTFDVDMKGLESLLDDSQLFNMTDGDMDFIHKGSPLDKNQIFCDPLKDSTNKNPKFEELNNLSTEGIVQNNFKIAPSRNDNKLKPVFKQSKKIKR